MNEDLTGGDTPSGQRGGHAAAAFPAEPGKAEGRGGR
jgi:hypothetical protein